jgi:sugar O-acyltransferase (sialic acid O-acetyltransferase NeuD family)
MINANDESAELVVWLVDDGASVRKGDTLCTVETTKSAVDVVAEDVGIFRRLVEAGAAYKVGHPIGFIAESADEAPPDVGAADSPTATLPSAMQARWTKKAKILADKLGIDLLRLAERHPDVVVGEEMVMAAATGGGDASGTSDPLPNLAPKIIDLHSGDNIERVIILGGGGGAALVLDILARTLNQAAVGILDNDPKMLGRELGGVPILGGFDLALPLWREGKFDAIISTVVRDVNDRAAIFSKFTELGIQFTNIIDPSVRIGRDVSLGRGNLIIYGGYIATGAKLGNNNFLAAGTYIEHHSVVGNHCTFGPRTSLSGGVLVGDRVKFGTQVAVEPQLEIGAESLIASGVVLTSHVPPRTIVKNSTTPVFRHVR